MDRGVKDRNSITATVYVCADVLNEGTGLQRSCGETAGITESQPLGTRPKWLLERTVDVETKVFDRALTKSVSNQTTNDEVCGATRKTS